MDIWNKIIIAYAMAAIPWAVVLGLPGLGFQLIGLSYLIYILIKA
jgi:hypothetical protein